MLIHGRVHIEMNELSTTQKDKVNVFYEMFGRVSEV